jgi:hypothetical protein
MGIDAMTLLEKTHQISSGMGQNPAQILSQ